MLIGGSTQEASRFLVATWRVETAIFKGMQLLGLTRIPWRMSSVGETLEHALRRIVWKRFGPDGETYVVVGTSKLLLSDGESPPIPWAVGGNHDPAVGRWLDSRVHSGDVVLDIGSHVGYFTLRMSELVGPGGRVLAIEASERNADLLQANVALNGRSNVELIRAAVGQQDDTLVDFYTSAIGNGRNSLQPDHQVAFASPIRLRTLDSILVEVGAPRVSAIKLDIEGFELHALLGASTLLQSESLKTVIVEVWPRGLITAGVEPRSVLTLLRTAGFELVADTGDLLTSDDQIDALCARLLRNHTYCNILAKR